MVDTEYSRYLPLRFFHTRTAITAISVTHATRRTRGTTIPAISPPSRPPDDPARGMKTEDIVNQICIKMVCMLHMNTTHTHTKPTCTCISWPLYRCMNTTVYILAVILLLALLPINLILPRLTAFTSAHTLHLTCTIYTHQCMPYSNTCTQCIVTA